MDVKFYENHLKTIADLQKIAEKHNMSIHFGFNSYDTDEFNVELLKACSVDEKVIQDLDRFNVTLNRVQYSSSKLWFELYDKEKGKYHTMSYIEESEYFEIENYDGDCVSDEFVDFYENQEYEDMGFYSFHYAPTVIYGFGNDDRVIDFRCYRPGMALKYFGDLVCDYLGEERICRVY